jgi:hypothetical protein
VAKLQSYVCRKCRSLYEFTHIPNDELAVCPTCGSNAAELQLGGTSFHVIVPTYPGAMRRKAGYVHRFANRPAEKIAVSVPGKRRFQ